MALLEESDLPTVLVGDFNCSPENPALEPIRRQLTDTCLAAGTTNARAALARGTLLYGQSRIDYIFVDPAFFSVSDAGLIAGKHHQASDHLGYYSSLMFKPSHT
jgi:endonuclease/exonuclease/phosphatase family metal-dependent hydrolase